MKIGTRIFFYLVAPLIVLMALFGWLGQRRSRAVLREELTREGRVLASTVQIAVQDAIRDRQIEDVHHLVNQISGYGGVLGVRVFDPSGALSYESANLKGVPVDQARSIAAALRERQVVESSTRVRGDPAISFVVPLVGKRGDLLGAVQVLQLVSFIETEALVAERAIAVLTTAMILAMGGVLLLVTRFSLGKPVEGLVRRFREVSSGDLASRVPARRGDEFGRLAQEFNGMCERLEIMQRSLHEEQEARRRMEGRLRQAEHLAGLGRLAAGLAHEIGTPLNVIVGRTESLTRRFSGNDAALRSFGIISAQIDRIARTVRGMLDFARLPQPRTGPTDVSALVHKVLEFLEPRFEENRIEVRDLLPADLPAIEADADQLHQVFLNIAMNAVDAMPHGGRLQVGGERMERRHPEMESPERPFLAVSFEDTGEGIPPENLERVFDPFFTTKEVGKGTGLGMSVSYGIVREHDGWIELESELHRRTRVTVFLPLDRAPAASSLIAAS